MEKTVCFFDELQIRNIQEIVEKPSFYPVIDIRWYYNILHSIIIPIKMATSLSIYHFQTHFGGVYHVQKMTEWSFVDISVRNLGV